MAIRQFGRRWAPWSAVVTPTGVTGLLFACSSIITYAHVYYATNMVLAGMVAAIVWEIWRDRADHLTSRYGLIVSYLLIGIAFGLRGIDGFFTGGTLSGSIPDDLLLQIHLSIAVIHTTSAGAFTLSLAYEKTAADLQAAALSDGLTNLPNRRAFEKHVAGLIERRRDARCGVVLIDIDHFKSVNDNHGHASGDEVLRRCAQILRSSLPPADFVARIGGEEFAVVVAASTLREVRNVVERLRGDVEACRIHSRGEVVSVTISAGVHYAPFGLQDLDEALRKADSCLYAAKTAGRNRIVVAAA